MANTSKTSVTPADVAAKAAEEKLIVPNQAEGIEKSKDEQTTVADETSQGSDPELTVIQGGKKTLKERLTAVAKKVEENKKAVIALGIAAAATTVAIAKVVAKRSLEKELAKAEDEVDKYEEIKDTAVASDETAA